MKKITNLFIAILFVANLWAQAPQKMSYQAIIRNAENTLVVNQSVGMQISILQGTENGSVIYTETQTLNTNANGLLSLEIGTGETTDNFETIDWENGPFFVKTECDPNGGSDYSITGVSQLLSVPFALHAATAETVKNVEMDGSATTFEGWDKNAADDFNGDYNSLSNKPDLSTIDTKLSETEVDEMVSNNGFLTSFTEMDGSVENEIQDLKLEENVLTITGKEEATQIDLSKYLDNTNTQLSETEVDEMVANNGYLTSFTEVDGDVTNEIQDLTFDATTNILKITNNGNATEINLSKYLDNTDTQLSETEVDEMVANNGYLTSFTEVDGDASNEIQDLTFDATSNILKITNNGTATEINLSKYLDNTNTQLSETEVDAFVNNNGYAADAELHAVAKSGSYTDLENTPVLWDSTYATIKGTPTKVSTFTNDAGYQLAVNDADVDATNEIQTISRSGLTVTLTGGGSFTDSVLTETEVDAFVSNNGYAADADLHAVAKSGSYADLENAPDLSVYATQNALVDSASAIRAALADSIANVRIDIPTIKTYQVGDYDHGGVVFWVDKSGQHGLVCAVEDLMGGNGIRWYAGTYITTLAKSYGVNGGDLNTAIIVSTQGTGDGAYYAARAAIEYQVTIDGLTYGGWYLPSNIELSMMKENRSIINETAVANGGAEFVTNNYWSSTESGDKSVYTQNFGTGGSDTHFWKSNEFRARAVRKF